MREEVLPRWPRLTSNDWHTPSSNSDNYNNEDNSNKEKGKDDVRNWFVSVKEEIGYEMYFGWGRIKVKLH